MPHNNPSLPVNVHYTMPAYQPIMYDHGYFNYTTASTASYASSTNSNNSRRNNNRSINNTTYHQQFLSPPTSNGNTLVTSPTSSTSSNSTATTAVSRYVQNQNSNQDSASNILPHASAPGGGTGGALYRSYNGNMNSSSNNGSGQQYHTNTNIYIRGLAPSTSDEWLYDMAKSYGTIVSHKAIIDMHTSQCKGYGFVMYSTEQEALVAMDALAKIGYQVSFAKESFNARLKNLQDEGSTNIYLSNLPLDMTEEQLGELFSPVNVVSTKILREPMTGSSRGVGFVRLESREDAQIAIDRFHSTVIRPGSAPLQVRFADTVAQKRLKSSHLARKRSNGSSYSSGSRSGDFHRGGGGGGGGGPMGPPMQHHPGIPDIYATGPPGASPFPPMGPGGAYYPIPAGAGSPSPIPTAMVGQPGPIPPGFMPYPAIYMPAPGTSPQQAGGIPYAYPPGPQFLVPPFYASYGGTPATSTFASPAPSEDGRMKVEEGEEEGADDGGEVYYEGDDLDEVHSRAGGH